MLNLQCYWKRLFPGNCFNNVTILLQQTNTWCIFCIYWKAPKQYSISDGDIWEVVHIGEQVPLHPRELFKVLCILQISGMFLRTCAVKKLACRTAQDICVTNLNLKSLQTSLLEQISLRLPHQGAQNMFQLWWLLCVASFLLRTLCKWCKTCFSTVGARQT